MSNAVKIAIVQKAPVYFHLKESMELAVGSIQEAVGQGAQLIVFGETWLSGYPAWIDHLPQIALWDHPETKQLYEMMWGSAIEIGDQNTKVFEALAKQHQVYIAIGVNEKVSRGPGHGTLYNSLLIFDINGKLAVHHRKLMPTYTEKLLYGLGDGAGLRTVDTAFGPIGGLICWEHWMPLTRQSMHDEAEQIHIAVWPAVHEMHQLASRHYAFEGRCFVIAVGQILQAQHLPNFLHLPDHLRLHPEKYLLNGGSSIIGPNGQYLLEPHFNQDTILYCQLDQLSQTIGEKMTLDVTGHYFRPDVLQYEINRNRIK